jgi:hypothetical protein
MRQDYKTEFSDFDFEIPQLPDGFEDDSWHNDVCPKFERKYNETQKVVFWVNYKKKSRRECGGCQFIVVIMESEDYFYSEPIEVIETNSWNKAINAINKLFKQVKV